MDQYLARIAAVAGVRVDGQRRADCRSDDYIPVQIHILARSARNRDVAVQGDVASRAPAAWISVDDQGVQILTAARVAHRGDVYGTALVTGVAVR